MRLLSVLVFGLFFSATAWANDNGLADALMNKVTLKLSSEQYVTTKTALVTVGVNAGVNDAGLEKIQDDVLKKLNGLSSAGEWHIISFDRSQDQSGLEKVVISAQARMPASALTNLRQKTKDMSKPGETYTLDNVEFTPSEDEIRAANIQLRGLIYQQAKDEVDRLNKSYPDQKYFVHHIDFVNAFFPQPPMPMMQGNVMRAGMAMAVAPTLAVGNKLSIEATVTLGALSPLSDHGLIKSIT